MCTCSSCAHTDSFADKGFAAWPRGEAAGPRRSAADYAAHVRYAQQWGRAYDGTMHERKECTVATIGTRAAPERLVIPKARWDTVGYHKKWIEAPETTADYIEQFERLNGLKRQEPAKAPARPHAPAKARKHFRERNRTPGAVNDIGKSATILAMPKPRKSNDSRQKPGRPPMPGRRIVIKLPDEAIEKAKQLGNDNIAEGVREALKRVKAG